MFTYNDAIVAKKLSIYHNWHFEIWWQTSLSVYFILSMFGEYIRQYPFVVFAILFIMSEPSEQTNQNADETDSSQNVQETQTPEESSGDQPVLSRKKRQLFDGCGRANAAIDGTEEEEFNWSCEMFWCVGTGGDSNSREVD